MKTKLLYITLYFLIPVICLSQRPIGISASSTFVYKARVPWHITSFNGAIGFKKHEINAGVDIYQSKKIVGVNVGYNYHIQRCYFVGSSLHAVKFSEGFIKPGNYREFEPIASNSSHYVLLTKSVLFTAGLGGRLILLRRATLNLMAGGGLNYYQIKKSENYDQLAVKLDEGKDIQAGNHFKGIIYAKIGLNIYFRLK